MAYGFSNPNDITKPAATGKIILDSFEIRRSMPRMYSARTCWIDWLVLFTLLLEMCSALNLKSVPALIFFGDSTVDVGNNNYLPTLFRCNHSPYGIDYPGQQATGRWSDGFMTLDYFAQSLGFDPPLAYLDPSADGSVILKGINFASGGAGLLDTTSAFQGTVSLSGQLQWYCDYGRKLEKLVGVSNASDILSNALYIISIGTNDYILNYYLPPGLPHCSNTTEFRSKMLQRYEENLQALYNGGARTVVVAGIPPMGCLPYTQSFYNTTQGSSGCVDYMNSEAQTLNNQMKSLLSILMGKLPGFRLAYIDTYNAIMRIIQNPADNGFKMTNKGCCGRGTLAFGPICQRWTRGTCQDPRDYVFFDAIHPSQKACHLLANDFLAQLMI